MVEEIERVAHNISMYREWDIVDSLEFGPRGRSMALRTIVRQWQQYNAVGKAIVAEQITDEEVVTRLRELACY